MDSFKISTAVGSIFVLSIVTLLQSSRALSTDSVTSKERDSVYTLYEKDIFPRETSSMQKVTPAPIHGAELTVFKRNQPLSAAEFYRAPNFLNYITRRFNLRFSSAAVVVTQVEELPNVWVATFSSQETLADCLRHASAFVEAGLRVRSSEELRYSNDIGPVAGIDLAGKDLLQYEQYREQIASTNTLAWKDSDSYKAFWEKFLLPELRTNPNIVLIAASLDDVQAQFGSRNYESVLAHEIVHANFLINPKFQRVMEVFWESSITSSSKEEIKSQFLGQYDLKNSFLILNETAAHLLQGLDKPSRFQPHYYLPLVKLLASRGINLVRLKMEPGIWKNQMPAVER